MSERITSPAPLPPTLDRLTARRVDGAAAAWRRGRDRMQLGGGVLVAGVAALGAAGGIGVGLAAGALLAAAGGLLVGQGFRAVRAARRTIAEATVAVRDPHLARAAAEVDRLVPEPATVDVPAPAPDHARRSGPS